MDIFISYSRKDLEFAQRITDELAANNLDTWIDWKSIPKGEDWAQEVYRGIEEAAAFLYIISPDSIRSHMCQKELTHAILNSKRIIPLVYKDINPTEAPNELLKYNWIYARPDKEDLQKSLTTLKEILETDSNYIRFHTRLQVKALEWERRNRDSSFLLRSSELAETENFINQSTLKDPKPTSLQIQYVLGSREQIERQKRTLFIGAISIAVAVLCLGGFSALTLVNLSTIPPEWVKMSTGLVIGLAIGAVSFWLPSLVSKYIKPKETYHKLSADEPDYLEPDTIFISYSSKDWEKFVKPLIDYLREQEFKIWIDQRKLKGGDIWLEEIDKALGICERMILCVSPNSLKSKYVKKEYRSFIDSDKKLVPIICRTATLPFELRDIQHIPHKEKELLVTTLKEYDKFKR